MYFWVQTFNLSPHIFREPSWFSKNTSVQPSPENQQLAGPDRTLNPSASVSRPYPTKIWKKNDFCRQMFHSFFCLNQPKKRDTKKQSPLLSHLHHLPLVNGEPLTLRVFEDQKDHRWMPFSSWTALPNGKPLRFLVAEFPLFPVVKIFLQRKMQHDDGSKLREYCMFGRYIYRGYL